MARQTQPSDGGVIDSEQYSVVPLSVGFHNRREGPVYRLAPPARLSVYLYYIFGQRLIDKKVNSAIA